MAVNQETISNLRGAISAVEMEIAGISDAGNRNTSEIENEHRRLEEALTKALRGEMVNTFRPAPVTDSELYLTIDESGKAAKEKAKKAAPRASAGSYAAAAVAAAGAAVAGVAAAGATTAAGAPAPGGKLIALGLGLISAAAAYAGAKFSAIAEDPPRNDFDTVARFEPINLRLPLPKPTQPHTTHIPGDQPHEDIEGACHGFAKQLIHMSLALEALVTSFERDQAVRDLRRRYQSSLYISASIVENRLRYEIAQTDAVAYNASECANLIDQMSVQRAKVNATWLDLLNMIHADDHSLSPRECSRHFRKLWEEDMESFREALSSSGINVGSVNHAVGFMIQSNNFPSELPKTLLSEDFGRAMDECSTHLRNVSATYMEMNRVAKTALKG